MLEKLWKSEGTTAVTQKVPPAQIAMLQAQPDKPLTEYPDERSNIIAQAHVFVEQWKQERLADKQEIERLKAELAEQVLHTAAERRRSDNMELDLATALNNIQTMQCQIDEYRKFMSMVRQLFDRWDIKKQPKKVKPKKTELPPLEVKLDEQQ